MVRVAGLDAPDGGRLPGRGHTGCSCPGRCWRTPWSSRGELTVRHARALQRARSGPALAEHGIEILRWKELSAAEQDEPARAVPRADLPGAHPAGGRPGAPVPVHLRPVAQPRGHDRRTRAPARRCSPGSRCRRCCPGSSAVSQDRFVPLEDVIAAHLTELFAGMEIIEHHAFRVTRDQGPGGRRGRHREPAAGAGAGTAAAPVRARRSGWRSRTPCPADVLDLLVTELDIDQRAVYRLPGPLDLTGLSRHRRPGPAAS